MRWFSFRMAWRETRTAWRHFVYFFVCIAIGVGALVSVSLFAANVERAVTREARGLLGGDLEVRLSHGLSESGEATLRSLAARGVAVTHVSELVAMAGVPEQARAIPRAERPTQIIELKAVEEGYPFYGTLRMEPARPLAELLTPSASTCPSSPCYGAVVQESLLIRMGLSVGDRVKVGRAVFTVTGLLRKEPDRVAGLFSLGPRMIISREGLAASDLVKPGSRVRERYLLRVPQTIPADPLLYELRGRLAGESARVIPYGDAQPQLRRFLDQLTRYLGLIGLTALFVGGIGVATSLQAFLREKLQTLAVLKMLGAEPGTVLRTYLVQALLLGGIGSLAGAVLGLYLQGFLPNLLVGLVPLDPAEITTTVGLTPAVLLPLLKGMALGLLTTLLFTLWPLLSVREIRPALILRRDVSSEDFVEPGAASTRRPQWKWTTAARDPVRSSTALGIAVGLAGLAVWQAGSLKIGLLYIAALATAVVLLQLAARVLVRMMGSLSKIGLGPRALAVRHAIGNLRRPDGHAVAVMMSLGVGVMVIVTVSLIERNLVRQLGDSRPIDAPTFFFIDIQPDQRDAVLHLIQERVPAARPEATPLVRSRLSALNGQPVQVDEGEKEETENGRDSHRREARKNWYLSREYVLTFLDELPKDNVITKGRWWESGVTPRQPLVSVEEEAANNLGLDLGATVEFEIQGARVSATVSSIRKVEWGNLSTNFFMILSPGALEGAPFTYVATVRVPPAEEVPLQQAIVASFPNVTAINIGDVLDSFVRILEHLSRAIRAVALFCILAGGIVMGAALATTRYRRLYESAIFKALGATRGLLVRSFAAEYALLGAAAGFIGLVLANVLSWAILHYVLDMAWTLQPQVLVLGLLLTILLTLAVGFLGTFRLLGRRPLAVLRHE